MIGIVRGRTANSTRGRAQPEPPARPAAKAAPRATPRPSGHPPGAADPAPHRSGAAADHQAAGSEPPPVTAVPGSG
ncbi:hypothetical protein ACFQZ4_02865 [Catellatospora coxensis]